MQVLQMPEAGGLGPFLGLAVLLVVIAYFCGSIPFGYIAGKMNGIDIREHGSHNIGATNTVRVLGKAWGLPVFLLDFLKGYIPVVLAQKWLSGQDLSPVLISSMIVLTAISAVMGHTYTCWLGFKGGKGVATTGGVILAIFTVTGSVLLATWALIFLTTRYVSLASIGSALTFPFTTLWYLGYFSSNSVKEGSIVYVVLAVVLALVVVLKHISNIKRLLAGTEHRAFSKGKVTKI